VQNGDSESAAASPATSLSNAKTHFRTKRTQHADDHLTQPSTGRCVGAKGICALKKAGLTDHFGGPTLFLAKSRHVVGPSRAACLGRAASAAAGGTETDASGRKRASAGQYR
jgi:hypothetical protein